MNLSLFTRFSIFFEGEKSQSKKIEKERRRKMIIITIMIPIGT